MKTQVKVIRKGNGFVGQMLNGTEVIYETPPCISSIVASRALMNHIGLKSTGSSGDSVIDITAVRAGRSNNSSVTGGRKCCGRS